MRMLLICLFTSFCTKIFRIEIQFEDFVIEIKDIKEMIQNIVITNLTVSVTV